VTEPHYELVVTAPAARAIRETLSEAVAFAVIDFITGTTRVELALRSVTSWRASGVLGGVPTVFSTESMRNAARSSFSVSGIAATSTERSEKPSADDSGQVANRCVMARDQGDLGGDRVRFTRRRHPISSLLSF